MTADGDSGGGGGGGVRPAATAMQHAIRVLAILDACSDPVADGDPAGGVAVIRAELRLQALDFWLRNPDYLAGELLTMVEQGTLPVTELDVIDHLLTDPEPDLHWYPMPRWHYGAYEALDDAFSVLSAYGLAFVSRLGGIRKTARSQFFLTAAGRKAVEDLRRDPVLSWYTEQVQLVARAAGTEVGSALKARQYQQAQYASTQLGSTIAPVHDLVVERLVRFRTELAEQTPIAAGGQS